MVQQQPGWKRQLTRFEHLLAPDFQVAQYANDLVIATNDSSDTEIDLQPALSRLRFSLEEIELEMELLVRKLFDIAENQNKRNQNCINQNTFTKTTKRFIG